MFRRVVTVTSAALALSGCLISKEPLISETDLPFKPDTYWQTFEIEPDGRLRPRDWAASKDNIQVSHLDFNQSTNWYTWRWIDDLKSEATDTYRFAAIPGRPAWVMMARYVDEKKDWEPWYIYQYLEMRGEYLFHYATYAADFQRYIVTDSAWKGAASWEITYTDEHEPAQVWVDSLEGLKIVLPGMIDGGFYTQVLAYKQIEYTEEVVDAPGTVQTPQEAPDASGTAAAPTSPTRRESLDMACRNGSTDACVDLATMLADGTEGPRDAKRAAELYKEACDRGHVFACFAGPLLGLIELGRAIETIDRSSGSQQQSSPDDDDWAPRTCCVGMHDSAPPIGSKHWSDHPWWCYTDYGGTETTWCVSRNGGVWEQSVWSRCAGVEGFCDEEMM